jgi:hypothetical protein
MKTNRLHLLRAVCFRPQRCIHLAQLDPVVKLHNRRPRNRERVPADRNLPQFNKFC